MISKQKQHQHQFYQSQRTGIYILSSTITRICLFCMGPYNKENITQLEQVQRKAARYVANRYHNTS
jgi:hypothetical protein